MSRSEMSLKDHGVERSPRSEPSGGALSLVADGVAVIASRIEERGPQAALMEAFARAQALCEASAARESSSETGHMLASVKMAVQTWQQVWPRLGPQQEFRLAVAREASQWSRRLQDLTASVRRPDAGGNAGSQ